MVVTQQVEQPVCKEVAIVVMECQILIFGFRLHGFQRDDDVAEFDFFAVRPFIGKTFVVDIGKREHVGRFVFAAELTVKGMDFIVIAEAEVDVYVFS